MLLCQCALLLCQPEQRWSMTAPLHGSLANNIGRNVLLQSTDMSFVGPKRWHKNFSFFLSGLYSLWARSTYSKDSYQEWRQLKMARRYLWEIKTKTWGLLSNLQVTDSPQNCTISIEIWPRVHPEPQKLKKKKSLKRNLLASNKQWQLLTFENDQFHASSQMP